VTEKEFLSDHTICKNCKDFWMKYHYSKAPWVCSECAKLEFEELEEIKNDVSFEEIRAVLRRNHIRLEHIKAGEAQARPMNETTAEQWRDFILAYAHWLRIDRLLDWLFAKFDWLSAKMRNI